MGAEASTLAGGCCSAETRKPLRASAPLVSGAEASKGDSQIPDGRRGFGAVKARGSDHVPQRANSQIDVGTPPKTLDNETHGATAPTQEELIQQFIGRHPEVQRHSEQQRLELLCRNAGQVGWHARFLPAPAGASKAGQPPSQERELAGQQPHKIAAMDFIRGAQEENLRTSSGSRVVSGQLVFESSPWKEDTTFKRKPSSLSRQPEVRAHEPIAATEPRLRLSPRSRSYEDQLESFDLTLLPSAPYGRDHDRIDASNNAASV